MTKKWWTSKLFWINLVATVTAAADQLLELNMLTPEIYGYVLGSLGIVNIVIRLFFTDTKLTS